jgi:hypothetical protein
MNRDNKLKRCSSCGESSNPTAKIPIYYCKHCQLHRVCTWCWRAEILKEDDNINLQKIPGKNRESSRRTGTTRTKERHA